MTVTELQLKPGRDKSVQQRHPWIFSGAVAAVRGDPGSGDTVAVRSSAGAFLAWAAYSPRSQIVARIWSWDEAEVVDEPFFSRRIAEAVRSRAGWAESTNAVRWVNAESDGMPGLVVDCYGEFAVCQFLSAGAEKWRREIGQCIAAQVGVRGVYERSDVEVRDREGLERRAGAMSGEEPPPLAEIWEAEPGTGSRWRFLVDVRRGHKTGFYLDQRDSRRLVFSLARRQEILNAFSYTGSFTIAAWRGGARAVTSVDSAGPALALADQNLALNGLPREGLIEGDVFTLLREYRDSGRLFDVVILDPPKFAPTQRNVERASRAYKDINWLALRLLRPGGHLITFSCSGQVSADLFQKILFGAALDAKREVQIVGRLSQAGDHPVRLTFPEGAYLKGLVCRAD